MLTRKKDIMPPRRRDSGFNFPGSLGTAIIGLLATLVTTGIISMCTLYTRVATLTDDVGRIETSLARHLDHSVDRDEWLRRDAAIQRAIDSMATKEDLKDLRNMIQDALGQSIRHATAK